MQCHNTQFANTGYTQTIVIPAELDERSLNDLASRLEHILDGKPTLVQLDCSCLDPVTPGHISSLRIVCGKCAEAGIAVRLTSISESLESFLRLFNLYDTFVGEASPNSEPSQPRQQPRSEHSRPHLRLQVRPTIDEIYAASEKLRCFLKGMNVPQIFAFEVETVFYEIATNIRIHGQLAETDVFETTVAVEPDRLVIRFVDSGPEFDPTMIVSEYNAKSAIALRQSHGLGLTMVRKMVDKMSFRREHSLLNTLTLEKVYDYER